MSATKIPTVVAVIILNQVGGGGGNAAATMRNDALFISLHDKETQNV